MLDSHASDPGSNFTFSTNCLFFTEFFLKMALLARRENSTISRGPFHLLMGTQDPNEARHIRLFFQFSKFVYYLFLL